MYPITIRDEELKVPERDVIERLQAKLARGFRSEAEAIWLRWVALARTELMKNRRLRIGASLDLYDAQAKSEQEREEERRGRLIACPLHQFNMTGIERVAGKIPQRLTCIVCEEWMPTLEAAAYARGFQAAGGNPDLVIDGFTG
jgi:hypothetical protein